MVKKIQRKDCYVKHDRPKALLVKALKPTARRSLCAEHLPVALAAVVESKIAAWPALRVGELRSLRQHFAQMGREHQRRAFALVNFKESRALESS